MLLNAPLDVKWQRAIEIGSVGPEYRVMKPFGSAHEQAPIAIGNARRRNVA